MLVLPPEPGPAAAVLCSPKRLYTLTNACGGAIKAAVNPKQPADGKRACALHALGALGRAPPSHLCWGQVQCAGVPRLAGWLGLTAPHPPARAREGTWAWLWPVAGCLRATWRGRWQPPSCSCAWPSRWALESPSGWRAFPGGNRSCLATLAPRPAPPRRRCTRLSARPAWPCAW